MKSIATRITLITALVLISVINVNAQDGAALFKAKCAACHTVGTNKLVGPGLAGINEKRSQEWLLKWIKDAPAFIASGDADAIAVFEEYNKTPMLPFPDMSDADIIAVLDFIKGDDAAVATTSEVVTEPVEPTIYSKEDIEIGKQLYAGTKNFKNGGPLCISCHNVTNDNILPGGLLAKDLTNVYERLGDAGIVGILNAPPFPAMANSYGDKQLTEDEVRQLTAFFKYANDVSDTQTKNNGFTLFAGGGIAGLFLILILISILWSNRKKESTKKTIFGRQLKGNDSIES
jgi:mono/diheme cytochrome c family protein